MEVGEISIIHSFARALCTVLLVLRIHKSHSCVGIRGKFIFACCRILASGSEVNLFLRVEFANSTRLAKFAKIKTP